MDYAGIIGGILVVVVAVLTIITGIFGNRFATRAIISDGYRADEDEIYVARVSKRIPGKNGMDDTLEVDIYKPSQEGFSPIKLICCVHATETKFILCWNSVSKVWQILAKC